MYRLLMLLLLTSCTSSLTGKHLAQIKVCENIFLSKIPLNQKYQQRINLARYMDRDRGDLTYVLIDYKSDPLSIYKYGDNFPLATCSFEKRTGNYVRITSIRNELNTSLLKDKKVDVEKEQKIEKSLKRSFIKSYFYQKINSEWVLKNKNVDVEGDAL